MGEMELSLKEEFWDSAGKNIKEVNGLVGLDSW